MSLRQFLAGNTVKFTWVNSGVTPSSLSARVWTGSETQIDSGAAMTSSGNGHYYYLHTVPSSPGQYVAETEALIGGKTYKNRQRFLSVLQDVN